MSIRYTLRHNIPASKLQQEDVNDSSTWNLDLLRKHELAETDSHAVVYRQHDGKVVDWAIATTQQCQHILERIQEASAGIDGQIQAVQAQLEDAEQVADTIIQQIEEVEEEIITKVNSVIRLSVYENVSSMVSDSSLGIGQTAITKGYHSINDGGSALYTIRIKAQSDVEDGGSVIFLSNGMVAEIITDGTVNVKQFGAYGDNVHNDTNSFNAAVKYTKAVTVIVPSGTYLISNYIRPNHAISIIGNGTVLIKGTGTDKYCFFTDGVSNLSFKNLKFEYFRRIFEIRNGSKISIDNCSASNMFRDTTLFEDNYFISFINCSRINVKNILWNNTNKNGDGIRFKGNCSNVNVSDVSGVSGDDFIAIVPDETDNGETAHYFRYAVFNNIVTGNNSFRGVRVQTVNAGTYVTNVSFEACNFEATTAEPVLFCSTGSGWHSQGISGGTISNVTFDTCKFKKYDGYIGTNNIIKINTQKLHGVYFKHSEFISNMAIDGGNFILLEYCNVYGLNISDCIFSDNSSTTLTKPILVDTNCILNSMYIKNIWFTGNVVDNVKTDFLTVKSYGKIYLDGGMLNNVNSIINAADATGNTVINLNSTIGSFVYGIIANNNVQVFGSMPQRASSTAGDVSGTDVKVINGNFLSSLTPSGQPSGVQYMYFDGSTIYPKIKINSSWKKISLEDIQ